MVGSLLRYGDLAFLLASCPTRWSRPGSGSGAGSLEVAAQRLSRQPWLPLSFRVADALQTDVASASVDGVVMAYGLRNLADPGAGLREIRRVLRPGGRAGVLDFNRLSADQLSGRFQQLYLRHLVVPVASAAGLREHYAYLEKSLQRFPTGAEQERLAIEAGFSQAQHRSISGQQMGILLLDA